MVPPALFVTPLPAASRSRAAPPDALAEIDPELLTMPAPPASNTPALCPERVPPDRLVTVPPASRPIACALVTMPALVTEAATPEANTP
jgi:hypothetical protein